MIDRAKKLFRSLPKIRGLYAHIARLEAEKAELLRVKAELTHALEQALSNEQASARWLLEMQLSAARDAEIRALLVLEKERKLREAIN